TDPQSMSELIGVLQRKVDLNDNDNELQIGRKSKYIMTLLSSQGVTGGQSVKEISRLSKMNEEYKREIILLRSEFEERLRELDEYKHGERNKNQNIDQFKRQVDELRQKDIENQQLISALQLQINQLRNVVVNIEPLQTPIPKQERKKKPEVIEFIETQPAPIIAPPQIPKQFDVPFHITAPPGSYYKDEDEYTYTATGNEYKTFALDNILTAGIFQVQFRVNTQQNILFIGIMNSELEIPFGHYPNLQPYRKDSMYFRYSGEICQNGNYLEGNAGMFSGDVVTIEINMDTQPRTICLFINGHQQPNFMANIPASVRPYFTIYQIGDSVTVLSLKRCTEPSIATLTQKNMTKSSELQKRNSSIKETQLDLINMSETFGENCIICSEIPAKTSFGELQTFAAQFGEIRKLWLEEPNGKEARQALVFFTTEQDPEKTTSKKLHFFNGEYIENNTEDYKKAVQTIYGQGIIEDIKIFFNRIEKERETIKEKDVIWPKVQANNLLCTKYACEILYHIACVNSIATIEVCQTEILLKIIKFIQSIPQGKVCSSHTRTIKKLIEYGELDIKEQLQ
ncbi:MAG: hypothetical protein EZS28_027323, partial [Streblomastix strix]